MKMFPKVLVAAVFLVLVPNACFALWEIAEVSKEQAKEMGITVSAHAAGPVDVRVDLEFKPEGGLQNVREVNLRISDGDKLIATAPLKEDRSNPGRVVVSFTADRTRLDKFMWWVMVPGLDGGTVYQLRVKEFVDLDKVR